MWLRTTHATNNDHCLISVPLRAQIRIDACTGGNRRLAVASRGYPGTGRYLPKVPNYPYLLRYLYQVGTYCCGEIAQYYNSSY